VTDAPPAIVFVHLGAALPPWLDDALFQARLVNTCPIYVVAEAAALNARPLPENMRGLALEEIGVSPKHQAFRRMSFLDRSFRGGFWTYTTERFFALESAMAALGMGAVVHLENDVLLYAGLEELAPKLAALYPRLAATFDNDQRCVPGFVYVHEIAALSRLTDFLLAALQALRRLPPQQLQGVNDMVLLGEYRARVPGGLALLPVIPADYPAPLRSQIGHVAADAGLYARDCAALGMIFDAAALGQYLGGIDPRNHPGPTRGFINESALYDPRLLKPRMVSDTDGFRRPVVETAQGLVPVGNLHIHAKDMRDFLSRPR
jgi:hypothetical protein